MFEFSARINQMSFYSCCLHFSPDRVRHSWLPGARVPLSGATTYLQTVAQTGQNLQESATKNGPKMTKNLISKTTQDVMTKEKKCNRCTLKETWISVSIISLALASPITISLNRVIPVASWPRNRISRAAMESDVSSADNYFQYCADNDNFIHQLQDIAPIPWCFTVSLLS